MLKFTCSSVLFCIALLVSPLAQGANEYPLKTCIVSGDELGGDMGKPIKTEYKGRTIVFCCKSCVRKFNKEPDKYLKKLDQELAKEKKAK